MILNIIYFIGGLLIGIGIMIALCFRAGTKLITHEDMTDYDREKFIRISRDVTNKNKKES